MLSYFFGRKGPYIDYYSTTKDLNLKGTLLCIDEGRSRAIQKRFFSICTTLGDYSSIPHLVKTTMGGAHLIKQARPQWPSEVMDTIQQLQMQDRPQLSFHYIYNPIGHSPRDYRHTNMEQRNTYQDYFLKSATKLDNVLQQLISRINLSDPNSIVVIFGDHGAWLSRGVSPNEDAEFVYKDRHMIELAVLKTENTCASGLAFHYSDTYATPSRVIAGIIRCLAKNPKEIDKLVDFIDPNKPIKELEQIRLKELH